MRSLDTGRLVSRSERHIRKMGANQQPEEQVSLVSHSLVSPPTPILKPVSHNHSHQPQPTKMADTSQAGTQRAAPPGGADQAGGPRCECSQSLAPPGSAPALHGSAPAPSKAPCPNCKACPHRPDCPSRKHVVFSDIVEVAHDSGYSVFTLHTQDEDSPLFVVRPFLTADHK